MSLSSRRYADFNSAWIPNTDLADLNPEECKNVTEKGKAKSLLAAYAVAAENHDLQHFKTMLDDHARAIQADIEAAEQREAEKAAKSDKKKRKSEVKIDTEDVEMEDADAPAKKSSKKRKKEADSDDEESEKVSGLPVALNRSSNHVDSLQRPPRPKSS
jgi:hypothetical protein